MKIAFFGTPEFAANILETLNNDFEVVLVVTQPDKPVGRKQIVEESAVSAAATRLGLPVIKPKKLKDEQTLAEIAKAGAELFVVVAYGKIIPRNILGIPTHGTINIHGSILPYYRGASPIHAALANGENETGVSIMLMDEEMDHGPVLETYKLEIGQDETLPELASRLSALSKENITQAIHNFINGAAKPVEQEHDQATYTKILSKEDGIIDWNQPARKIYNQYRAYCEWPGVWTHWNSQVLKIQKCAVSDSAQSTEPGRVIEDQDRVFVGTGHGMLELLEVQLEGKNKTPVGDFIRGHKDFIGSKLS